MLKREACGRRPSWRGSPNPRDRGRGPARRLGAGWNSGLPPPPPATDWRIHSTWRVPQLRTTGAGEALRRPLVRVARASRPHPPQWARRPSCVSQSSMADGIMSFKPPKSCNPVVSSQSHAASALREFRPPRGKQLCVTVCHEAAVSQANIGHPLHGFLRFPYLLPLARRLYETSLGSSEISNEYTLIRQWPAQKPSGTPTSDLQNATFGPESPPRLQRRYAARMGGRVVDCARLESVFTAR
jgi:hypothetical protein